MKRENGCELGGGPPPSTSALDNIDEALTEATDVELHFAIDSDTVFQEGPSENCGDIACQVTVNEQSEDGAIVDLQADHSYTTPSGSAEPFLGEGSQDTGSEQTSSVPSATARRTRTISRRSGSRLSDYTASSQATARNVRSRVITDEFALREANYKRAQEREEEVHRLKIAEREFLVKAAEENYRKAVVERQNAEEVLRYNKALREAAEAKKL
ncbi:hypothetical protein evm_008055 [Chilo suppressalis]|nr:hypothetical protein evm_008055 [Chilo suppressalis]